MFKYISPVDLNISIDQSVLDWVENYKHSNKADNSKTISRQVDKLIYHTNPPDRNFPMDLVYNDQHIILTLEAYLELKSTISTAMKYFRLSKAPKYSRIALPAKLKKIIIDSLPLSLQQYDPTPVLQIIEGEGMLPHTDFGRTCSLYFLLTSEKCHTFWYESKGKVDLHQNACKHGFLYANANIEHIELKKTCKLKKHQWYVFDNYTYHAVKSIDNHMLRKGLIIEFNTLSAEELYLLLK